jgi:hypothetical protein
LDFSMNFYTFLKFTNLKRGEGLESCSQALGKI